MRPLLQQLAPRKESLTMENVFAPQAQQLQAAISQELNIAAEVCRAYATSYDLLLRLRPFRAQSVPNSRWGALGRTDRETERERERQTDRVTFSLTMSKAQFLPISFVEPGSKIVQKRLCPATPGKLRHDGAKNTASEGKTDRTHGSQAQRKSERATVARSSRRQSPVHVLQHLHTVQIPATERTNLRRVDLQMGESSCWWPSRVDEGAYESVDVSGVDPKSGGVAGVEKNGAGVFVVVMKIVEPDAFLRASLLDPSLVVGVPDLGCLLQTECWRPGDAVGVVSGPAAGLDGE